MTSTALPETKATLSDDRTEVTLAIGSETLHLDANSLQNLIGHLGLVREQMEPAVPRTSPEDRQFMQVASPTVEIVPSDDATVVRIALRTPGYGWVGYQFRRQDAAEVGRHLVEKYGADTPS